MSWRKLIAAFLLAASLAAQSPSLIRMYDARALVAPRTAYQMGKRSLPSAYSDSATAVGAALEEPSRLDTGLLRDLLSTYVAPELIESGQLDVLENGRVVVTGGPDAHNKVAAFLRQLTDYLAWQVVIEIHEVPVSILARGQTVLDEEAADELLAELQAHAVHRTLVTVGDPPAVVQTDSARRFVRDYDIEVADESSIADPKVDVVASGSGFAIAAKPAGDGRLIVDLHVDRSDLAELRAADFPVEKSRVALRLPRLEIERLQASSILGPGQAMLVGSSTGRAYLLRVQYVKAPLPPHGSGWRSLEVSGLHRVQELSPIFGFPQLQRPGDDWSDVIPVGGNELFLSRVAEVGLLEYLLCRSFSEDFPVRDELGLLWLLDPGQDELDSLVATHAQLVDDSAQQVSIEVRFGVLPDPEAASVSSGRIDAAQLAGRFANASVLAPALTGEWFQAMVGHEVAFVADIGVEIATLSAIGKPVIGQMFDGFALRGRASPAGSNSYRLELNYGAGEIVGAIAQFDTQDPRLGKIDAPEFRTNQFMVSPTVQEGAWTIVRQTPIHGTKTHALAVARVVR